MSMTKAIFLVLPITILLTGCLSTRITSIRENEVVAGSPVSTLEVSISSSQFSPAAISMKAGQTLTIINRDAKTYTLISDPHPTHDQIPSLYKLIYNGDSVQISPAEPGIFGVHIEENPSIRLELSVTN